MTEQAPKTIARPAGVSSFNAIAEPRNATELADRERLGSSFGPAPVPYDLIRLEDIKPQLDARDFVEGILTEGGSSVVYGQSNVGKTFWGLDLAAHVATGRPWRNGERAIDPGTVVYLSLEGGGGFDNRIEALRLDGRLDNDAPFCPVKTELSLLERKDLGRIIATLSRAEDNTGKPVKLVIIDTLSRAMAGGNENTPEGMTAVVAGVDLIRTKAGAHVMLIHHSGKNEARGSRGHSSLQAAVDTEIELSRGAGDPMITARLTKQRDLPGGLFLPFWLRTIEIGTNRRDRPVTSCVVVHDEVTAAGPSKPGRKTKATLEQLLDLLPQKSTGGWQQRAEDELGVKRSTFYSRKKEITEKGLATKSAEEGWIRTDPPTPED